VNQADEVAKGDRAESGHDSDNQAENREINQSDSADIVASPFGRTGVRLPGRKRSGTPNGRTIGQRDRAWFTCHRVIR
jgi:hypothetical protein